MLLAHFFLGIGLLFVFPPIGIAYILLVSFYYIYKPNSSSETVRELGEGETGSVRSVIKSTVFRLQRGECGHVNCAKRKYLALHHKIPRNLGGDNRVSNLVYLCPEHHAMAHDSGNGEVSYASIPRYLRGAL